MPGQAPPLTDERALLLAFIAQQRDGVRNAAYGLTDEQARMTPTAGSLSIGGLVTHVAAMERSWMDLVLQRAGSGPQEDQESDYTDGFRLGPGKTLSAALAGLDEAMAGDRLAQALDRSVGGSDAGVVRPTRPGRASPGRATPHGRRRR